MADTPDGFLFEHRVLDVWAIHAAIPAAVGEHYLGILKRQCESDPGAWRLVPFARLDAGAARSRNEGEAYLRGLREELEARDAAAVELAREAHEAVA